MPVATLSSKGQITIPKEIREEFRLREGDTIEFTRTAGGTFELRPKRVPFEAVAGILKKLGRSPLRPADKDAAIEAHMKVKHTRPVRRRT